MEPIRTVAVAGCGTMGAGIALVAARAGFRTLVYDTREDALARARKQTEGFFAKSVARGKMTGPQAAAALDGMTGTTDLSALAQADIVIEAVFEDLAVKHRLFADLNRICPPATLFASNTSTLSITQIAGGSGRADRFVGMHFCLPAPLMKLVEMAPGLVTAEASYARAWAFCEALGQRPVRVKDDPGFVLNYFLIPFNNDAVRLVDQGVASPADIDRALKGALGYRMGPLELLDLVGMDTQLLLCDALYGITGEPRAACPPLVRRMIAAGHLGRKTGRGFYTYDGDTMFGG
jgi:3-hydroxybutyryl-CoA dehydrogenase